MNLTALGEIWENLTHLNIYQCYVDFLQLIEKIYPAECLVMSQVLKTWPTVKKNKLQCGTQYNKHK